MGSIIGLIFVLAFWNWIGGIVATLVPAAFVFRALKKAEADPDSVEKTRTYLRWVAGAHLFNHSITVLGSLLFCVGSMGEGVPAWAAWTIFGIYFLTTRLLHIVDALTRLIKADAMPAAANM